MVLQGVIRGNTVLLENNEDLMPFDGQRVLITLPDDFDLDDSTESVAESRLRYLEEMWRRPHRPTDRSAEEINRSIREMRDHDRF